MSALEVHGLSRFYGDVPAVADVSLSVAEGSRTAIVGPSGSGKTTLLRMIAGFEMPDSGRITLGGEVLADGATMLPAHRRQIGYVPQDGALFPHMTVAGNIGFGLVGGRETKHQRIAQLAEMVSLAPQMLDRWPHELSGGQQQRVALARALAQNPRLMLLDEPFSALDTGLRAAMRKAVAQVLGDSGVTAILVTHDQEEALSFGDQLAVMRQGRLVQVGPPMGLYLRPRDEETAVFLGDAIVMAARIEGGWADCELGRLPVSDSEFRGQARIMLRPEQLRLSDIGTTPPGLDGRMGVVTDKDFGGSNCTVTVRLSGPFNGSSGQVPERCVPVRVPGIFAPAQGSSVHLSVIGEAHVLAS
ncbi:Fe(3+) ions import ATP-binding protein FbpC 2 [compost metagenome]